ncbi:CPBP family intramembrane glutamic endopeptidase [Arthrobacter sp. UM1]|uniref:CPBP family intramembrane glutamic endopeptidase n=1 Tax=Arthrobacter sp. UM1 TaxID=2766776 RepID=UPI001CF6E996|nr:type II CAAX endopeptidase family protein [Arthrobacter sp. UM1]MCB4208034.1 CPBP family intramembrane metalloprotease [Arthrobacter sp. UM1]
MHTHRRTSRRRTAPAASRLEARGAPTCRPATAEPRPAAVALRWEIGIVLALSLGKSAVYSLLDLANALSKGGLKGQSVALNARASAVPLIDALYQLAGIVFSLAPVALVVFLLWREGPSLRAAFAKLGLPAAPWAGASAGATTAPAKPAGPTAPARPAHTTTPARPARAALRDLALGAALFLAVGLATLALYTAGRAAGLTARIEPSGLSSAPWNAAILALSAVRHGILEETVMLGYLFWRGRQLAWAPWAVVVGSAVLRSLYHAYQGFGPMLGNLAMGILFGALYSKIGRLAPLIIAHALLDLTAFLAADWFSRL